MIFVHITLDKDSLFDNNLKKKIVPHCLTLSHIVSHCLTLSKICLKILYFHIMLDKDSLSDNNLTKTSLICPTEGDRGKEKLKTASIKLLLLQAALPF